MKIHNKKDEALRLASQAFIAMSFGAQLTPKELKNFGDLCALALPMKYRFGKEEIGQLRSGRLLQ